ncbi:MAG: hypothetical protein ACXVRE_00510 [Gaiellaceae bacterium]
MTGKRVLILALVALVSSAAAGAALEYKPAKHRRPPDLVDNGWKPKPLRIIAFVPSDYPRASRLAKFPQAIVHSKWLKRLEEAYSIPTNLPASGKGFVVSDLPKLPKKDTKASADFDSWVTSKLQQKGLTAHPAYQTIFILFVRCKSPQSVDGFGCVSHHPSVGSGPLFTSLDSYAMVLSNPTASDDSTQDALTATATHELAEAATDTGPKGWRLTSADRDHPWGILIANPADSQKGYFGTSPFVEDEGAGNIESADMLAGSRWFETYQSVRYEYVRVFSKYGNDHRDDPGVPPTPHAFYNVQPKSDWYFVTHGKSKTVTVTGWSTKSLPRWNVTADMHAWEGSSGRGGATKVPAYCSLAKSTFKVGNRGTFSLKVTAKSSAKKNNWCVVRLVSQPVKASANGDTSHRWYVGFIIS